MKGNGYNYKLSAADVVAIKKRIAEGEKLASIAFDFKVCMVTIHNIKTGKIHK